MIPVKKTEEPEGLAQLRKSAGEGGLTPVF